MFSKKATVLIFFCLLVPFFLRLVSYKLEPYPAILFPSGEGKVKVPLDGPVENFTVLELQGYSTTDGWLKLDEEEFISPIPRGYLSNILKLNKGLFSNNPDIKKYSNPVLKFLTRNQNHAFSQEELEEVRSFFSSRLKNQGFEPDQIKVVKFQITSYPESRKVDKRIIEEEIIKIGGKANL
jgi:hypothetical protein